MNITLHRMDDLRDMVRNDIATDCTVVWVCVIALADVDA